MYGATYYQLIRILALQLNTILHRINDYEDTRHTCPGLRLTVATNTGQRVQQIAVTPGTIKVLKNAAFERFTALHDLGARSVAQAIVDYQMISAVTRVDE